MTGPPRDIDAAEEDLRQRAAEDLPALELARKAGDFLASIIAITPVPPSASDQSPRERQHHAIWLMAIQAFRALRVAMNTIAIGYDDQAVGKVRLSSSCTLVPRKRFRTNLASTRGSGSQEVLAGAVRA